jgi:hypothetical protein
VIVSKQILETFSDFFFIQDRVKGKDRQEKIDETNDKMREIRKMREMR